jgi:hypothetical protein
VVEYEQVSQLGREHRRVLDPRRDALIGRAAIQALLAIR